MQHAVVPNIVEYDRLNVVLPLNRDRRFRFIQVRTVTRLGMASNAGQPLQPIPPSFSHARTCLMSKTVRADSIYSFHRKARDDLTFLTVNFTK